MKYLKRFLSMFPTITTCVLVIAGLEVLEMGMTVGADFLFKILASGAATALVTALVYPYECESRKQVWVRMIIHFVLLCATMCTFGVWFDWIDFSFAAIVYMCVCVAVVYLLTFVIQYIIEVKQTDELNRKFRERREKKNIPEE